MARAFDKNYFLNNPNFTKIAKNLYGERLDFAAERYSLLTDDLTAPLCFFSSPGRSELIGNHTDHNNGLVLATTIDLDTVACVMKTSDKVIKINSFGYPTVTVSIDDTEIREAEQGTSFALVRGIIKGFLENGFKVGGFVANMHSTVYKGAGVSSSASFELLVCEILNTLYNGKRIDYKKKAIISQYAENVYFGKPSGLMDQLTISRGGVSYMDFKDTKNPTSDGVKWKLKTIAPVIVNCGGDHCNLTDEYSEIRSDMQGIAAEFGYKVLRELPVKEFYDKLPYLLEKCGGRAALRAMHYFEENERVKKALRAIEKENAADFCDITNASGISSYEKLQNCFAKKDADQRLALGLQLAKAFGKTLAARVHGGGFAGTLLAFLRVEDLPAFAEYMATFFGKENVFSLSMRDYGAIEVVL